MSSSRPHRLSSPSTGWQEDPDARLDSTSDTNNEFDDNNNDEAFLDHSNNVADEASIGIDTNGASSKAAASDNNDSQLKGTTLGDLVPEDTDAQLLLMEDDGMLFNEDLEDLLQVNVNDSTDSNGHVSSSNLQSGPLTSMIAFREGRDLDKKSNKKKEHSNKNPPPPPPGNQDAKPSQEEKEGQPAKDSPLVATSKKKKEKKKAHEGKESSSDEHATSKQKKDLPNKESTVNKDEATSEQQEQQQVQDSAEIVHPPNQDENDHGDEASGQEQDQNKDPQVKSSTVSQGAKDSGNNNNGHLGQANNNNNNDANPYKKHNQATTTEQQAETLVTDPSHSVPTRPKKPPVPQQKPDAHIQCSPDAPLFSRITCSVALATSHHPIWTTLGLTVVILLFCWRCCCRRSADHRGEYRAVAARYASDAFDDVFADNISEQEDDGFHDANGGGDSDGVNGNFDEAGWSKSKKRVIEMRNLGDEENGGLTLEEMNG